MSTTYEKPEWDGDGLLPNPAWPDHDNREWLVPEFELPEGVTTEMQWAAGHALRRHRTDRSGDYGVHGMTLLWIMKGPAGAVSFELMTLWTPELEQGPFGTMKLREYPGIGTAPMGGAVRLHMIPGHDQHSLDDEPQECPWVEGGKCMGDATYTAGEGLVRRFVMSGDPKAVWWSLLRWYDELVDRAFDAAVGPEAGA